MRTTLTLLVAGAALAGCTSDGPLTPPPPEIPEEIAGGAYQLTMEVATGAVTITPPAQHTEAAEGLSLSILGREVIGMEARNGVCTPAGKRVHCTFDLAIRNRHEGVTLVSPSSLPTPPAGTDGLIVFPYAAAALGVPGGGAVPSDEWDRDPINMFNDFSGCGGRNSDCYRYEVYPGALEPEQTSDYRRVGFYVDRGAVAVSAYIAVAADVGSTARWGSTQLCGAIGKFTDPAGYGTILSRVSVGQTQPAVGMPSIRERGFCEMEIGGLAGRRIARATLRLYQAAHEGLADPFAIYGPIMVDHISWQEGTFPASIEDLSVAEKEALYEATGAVSLLDELIGTVTDDPGTGVYRSVDVTAAVAADVAAGRSVSQFRIRFSGELDGSVGFEVSFANGVTYPQEPELVVSYANE